MTGFLESSVLNVFASSPAEKDSGAGEEGQGGAESSSDAATGSMQVQPPSKQLGLSHQQQTKLSGVPASSKPGRTVSSASLDSDLPELGRLECTKTPNTSVPTSDEEPACRGSSGNQVVSLKKSKTNLVCKTQTIETKSNTHSPWVRSFL